MESSRCKAFLISAETGSFSKAAEILGYTPSGVSQLVTAFENDLGFPLLLRNKRGVMPTPDGERIAVAVRELLSQERRIYEIAAEIKGLSLGEVTNATYPSISTHWLPGVIRGFREEYPHIKIKLMEGIRQEIIQWLEEKRADVAFMSHKEPMSYDWIPLAEDQMLAVLPKTHQLARAAAYPLQKCRDESFIMPALGRDADVAALFEKNGLEPDVQFTTLQSFAALSMVEQGLGMTVINELITRNWPCDVVKLPLDPPQKIILGMALFSLENAAPAVKRFVKYAAGRLNCPGGAVPCA